MQIHSGILISMLGMFLLLWGCSKELSVNTPPSIQVDETALSTLENNTGTHSKTVHAVEGPIAYLNGEHERRIFQRRPNGKQQTHLSIPETGIEIPKNGTKHSMPMMRPDPDIDYKIAQMEIDPNIDYKMLRVGPQTWKQIPDTKKHLQPSP